LKKLILTAAVVLIGLLLLQWILGPVSEKRNWEIFPGMVRSSGYESQSSNPHFADGMTQRRPEIGAIARGHMPFLFGASEEESERAGRVLESPFPPGGPADPERGRVVYEAFCQVCHGAAGEGGGAAVSKRGYPPPPSLLAQTTRTMPEGKMFHILTLGYRNMPPYGALIDREDRWRVIHHVRRLQENP
jgi:mono/diheme cytochrome c family protein